MIATCQMPWWSKHADISTVHKNLLLVAGVGDDLVRAGQKAKLGIQGLQRGVPGIEEPVAQVLRVDQAPLPPAVVIAPPVALPATSAAQG